MMGYRIRSVYFDELHDKFISNDGGNNMNNEYMRWSEFMRNVYRIDDSTTQLKLYNQMKDWERHYAGTDYTKYSHGRLYGNDIQKVIFNNPATIVFWKDGTKTVVKCGPDDIYDAEKGLAMAICKKVYGNENFFHKIFKKWMPREKSGKER